MPLNAANFVLNGHAASADLMQFVNLLTGVMTDQPVTITNTLTATTHLGNGTVPAAGANGQVLTKSAAASYSLTWTTPFSQANADALYQTPAQAAALYLPLTGGTLTGPLLFNPDNTRDIGAAAATRPRTVYAATSFIGPGAVPVGGTANQVLQKNTATAYDVGWVTLPVGFTQVQADARYLQLTGGTLSGALHIGSANETIRNPVNAAASLSIESSDGSVYIGSGATGGATQLTYNGYFDGTNWQRFNTANPYLVWWIGPSQVQLLQAPAGTNPIGGAITSVFQLDNGGNATFVGSGSFSGALAVTGQITARSTFAVGTNLYLADTNNYLLNSGGNLLIRTGGYVSIQNTAATGNANLYCATLLPQGGISGTGSITMNNGSLVMNGPGNITITGAMNSSQIYITGSPPYLFFPDGSNYLIASAGYLYVRFPSGLVVQNASAAYTGITCAQITMYAGLTLAYSPAVITTSGSNLYIRASTGVVSFDSGGITVAGVISGSGDINSNGKFGTPNYMCTPLLYLNANVVGGPYIQAAGAAIRYDTALPAGSVHSFESQAGGLAPCQASAFTVGSARKFKDNIVPLGGCLERVLDPRVEPVSFMLKLEPGAQRVGFIAEDMALVIPEVVHNDIEGEPTGLHYGALVSVLWGALREMHERIQTLENAA